MSAETLPNNKGTEQATRAVRLPPPRQSRTSPVPRLKRILPNKSLEKAAKVFKNFSLSKFSNDSSPPNHLAKSRVKDPAAVQAMQRKIITQNIKTLRTADTLNPGMTLAVPEATIKKLLPSFKKKAGTIGLSDLLGLMRQNMKGTEF